MGQIVAFSILAVTVGMALGRPQIGSRRFGHVEAALIGAVLAVATGSVSLHQVAHAAQILAFPAVTIVSLMTITVTAEQTGLLRLMADRLARRAGGDAQRLFRNLFILGALTGTFFTNDAAILILTPLVFSLVERVQERSWTLANRVPFYFAVLYVGNLVGALVISNPINLLVSSIFDIGFVNYAAWMILPALTSMAVSFIGLKYCFRRQMPRRYRMLPAQHGQTSLDKGMIRPCAAVLLATLFGFCSEAVTGIPVWLVALTGAAALSTIYVRRGHRFEKVVRGIGWDVIVFVFGIFVVVIGLRNQGFAHALGDLITALGTSSLPGLATATGFVAAVCSALFNNHPTAGLMIWVVQDFERPLIESQLLAFAALIGGDLGPKMVPIGSLAALMWFRMLRVRGVHISYLHYMRIGIPITLTAVALSLLVLNLQWIVYAKLFL